MKNIDATTRLMMHSGISSAGVVPDELMNSHELCDFLKITPQQMYVCRRYRQATLFQA